MKFSTGGEYLNLCYGLVLMCSCIARFELIEMARKVLLISVLSVVNENADSYLWTAFLVSFAAQILFSTVRPYEDPRGDMPVHIPVHMPIHVPVHMFVCAQLTACKHARCSSHA